MGSDRLLGYTVAAVLLLFGAACGAEEEERPARSFDTDILRDTFKYDDSTPRLVDYSQLRQGCPERDCIPAIDEPRFVAADEADFLKDDEFVVAIDHAGVRKAYPTRIMLAHEIVNDDVGGEPLAITFCPLCGSATAIFRRMDGVDRRFGVSGVLYNSDLVMYDDTTESLWSQIEGRAIVGPSTGQILKDKPITVTRWKQWRKQHPDTLVLSTDTGFDHKYDKNPYEEYETDERVMLPAAATDKRLHPKKVVYGIDLDGTHVAYSEDFFAQDPVRTDTVNGRKLRLSLLDDGTVTIVDTEDGQSYAPLRLYWFAWYVFHPETELRSSP